MTKRLVALTVAALFTVLSACGSNSGELLSETKGASDSKQVVKLAIVPGIDLAALYLGRDQGFFKDAGVDFEPVVTDSGATVITGVIEGSYDVGYAAPTPVWTAVSKGAPLRHIGGSNSITHSDPRAAVGIVVKSDSGINKVADLAGKSVAVNALRAASDFCLQADLKKQNVDANKLKTIELPLNQIPTSVKAGDIDAGVLFEPFTTAALEAGLKFVANPCQEALPDGSPYGFYFTSEKTQSDKAETIEKFNRAAKASIDYANAHHGQLRAAMAKYANLSAEQAKTIHLTTLIFDIDRSVYDENVNLMADLGFIKSASSVKGYWP